MRVVLLYSNSRLIHCLSTSADQTQHTSSGSSTNVGAIVGGVIGGLAFLTLLLLGLLFFLRRHREAEPTSSNSEAGVAIQTQAQRNNVSSSREPMMIEPFLASRSVPVPRATGASTVPTTASSSNIASQWPSDSSQQGRTGSSTVTDMSAPSIPPSKQNFSSNRRPSTHPSSDSQYVSLSARVKQGQLKIIQI